MLAHAAVAWSLRAHPLQNVSRNFAFPAWALAAGITALIFALTPAAAALDLKPLSLSALALTAATATAAAALAAGSRRALSISQRL